MQRLSGGTAGRVAAGGCGEYRHSSGGGASGHSTSLTHGYGGHMTTNVEQLLARKKHQIYSLKPDATIREAVNVFGEKQIGAVLICEERTLLGVLSERDCIHSMLWQ